MTAVTWTNLNAFKAQLTALGPTLLEETDQILRDSAAAAKAEIVYAYPKGPTGNLKRGVKFFAARGSWIGGAQVKQTAPHGHLYEYGTVVRKTKDNQFRNRMFAKQGFPDGRPTFGPIAAQHQRQALILISAALTRAGAADVEGDAEWSPSSRLL